VNPAKIGVPNALRTSKKKKYRSKDGFRLFLLCLPFFTLIFLFSYLPLHGWAYAFFEFRAGYKLFDTPFVGLAHFSSFFENYFVRQDVMRVLRNTLSMSLISIATSWLPMVFAIFLAEVNKSFRKTIQTITTIPHFISWVLVFSLAFAMFSTEGFFNSLLLRYGLTDQSIRFLYVAGPQIWLVMWAYGTWKGLGWSAILYIAGIAGIDVELYEAAVVDGATRFQRICHITIPSLLPTFFVLLLLSIANLLNSGMDQYFVFQNPFNRAYIEVLDLYVYNRGIVGPSISFATAAGVLKSVVGVTLLFIANGISKLLRGDSIF